MAEKTYRLSPGPINIPERVLRAMNISSLHHRTPEFSRILARLLVNLQEIYCTKQPVLPIHSTGRGALEATITNLFSGEDEIISICNGRFGTMYAGIAQEMGLRVHRVSTEWEKDIDLDELRRVLESFPAAKAVTVVHNETSTGVENDIQGISRLSHEYEKLLLVDCVSSLGGMKFLFDEWNVDSAVTASQKSLMGPTGMAFIVLSKRAWQAAGESTLAKSYFSFPNILNSVKSANPETPGSTPVVLVAAMAESTTMILEEGLSATWERHRKLSNAVKESLAALGFELFPKGASLRSRTTTVVSLPKGLEAEEFTGPMNNLFGIVVTSGLGEYKNKILRLGHMGNFYQRDALILLSSFEAVLHMLGFNDDIGRGLKVLCDHLKD